MSRPSIILITGSFAPPELYDNIVEAVTAANISIKVLHLPSVGLGANVGREGKPPTMFDDAAFISAELSKLADAGAEIILVAHSYGGIPATESTKGLTKRERALEGKAGGVVRIAYMTALVPDIGASATDMLSGIPKGEQTKHLEVDDQGWMFQFDLPHAAALSFSDLPAEEGLAWAKRMSRHSAASFASPLSHAGYLGVPVSYLLCENDLVIPATVQRGEIEMIESKSGNKVDVQTIACGHTPTISHTQSVVEWLTKLAS